MERTKEGCGCKVVSSMLEGRNIIEYCPICGTKRERK